LLLFRISNLRLPTNALLKSPTISSLLALSFVITTILRRSLFWPIALNLAYFRVTVASQSEFGSGLSESTEYPNIGLLVGDLIFCLISSFTVVRNFDEDEFSPPVIVVLSFVVVIAFIVMPNAWPEACTTAFSIACRLVLPTAVAFSLASIT